LLPAFHGVERELAVDGKPMLGRERLGHDQRVRLRQEYERIIHDGLIAGFEIVVTEAAIPGHVDGENQ
jgi:hypothetical protein